MVEGDDGVELPADACSRKLKDNWNAPTWLASVNYELTPGTMAYGSVTTGYRAGGFGIRATQLPEQQPFDEETVITYEVGLKSDWALQGWSFRTNVAVYHQDFEDIQRTFSIPIEGVQGAFVSLTGNAAEAVIQGAEIELHASSDFGLDLTFNYAYTDTEYKKYLFGADRIDVSGESIEWIPKEQLTATVRYTLPVAPSVGDMSLQASYYHQSRQLATLHTGNDPTENRVKHVDSYSVVNYNMDWRNIMGSNFDLSLYVKNAHDKRYPVGGLTVVESLGVALWNYGEPRTYGASLRYNF